MCGIVGFTGMDTEEMLLLARDALSHRGPNAVGALVRDGIALGHTRLSIIDLSMGAQPMSTPDGELAVIYNGEIYNFRELRDTLEHAGHAFHTHSDTEVLLYAYREWGPRCVEKLRGMFAFAIADFGARRLFLARDHLGIKPLVYSFAGGCFSFASEIQALRSLPWVEASLSPDPQGIYECLRFGYSCAPVSAYRQIRKLPPAHWLDVALEEPGREALPRRYWRLEHQPDESLSAEQCEEIADTAVRDSVKAHLVADVPFGAFLSGGVDSSLIVSYMSEILDEPVRTFSIGFEDNAFDERPYARQVAEAFGTRHFEEVVQGNAIALVPQLIRHYGEPFGDSSAIPTWHVARLARRHVPMVLTGDGGDEFFAGYASYAKWLGWVEKAMARHPSRRRPAWRNRARVVLSRLMPRRFPADPPLPVGELPDWLNLHGVYWTRDLASLLRPEFAGQVNAQPDPLREAFAAAHGQPSVTLARHVDMHGYLPNDILTKVDIASMMHGLECRTPLTDVRIAELSARIPWQLLIHKGGRDYGWTGKLPLRHLLARRLPSAFLDRPKQGFSIPATAWLRQATGPAAVLCDRLRDPRARLRRWLQPKGVDAVLDAEHGARAWHLLVLEEWLSQNGF